MAPAGERTDPHLSFNFLVEIDALSRAAFQECSGLESNIEVVEYSEGGEITPKKLPGRTKYSNIVLKRGVTNDRDLFDWYLRWAKGEADPVKDRVTGSIILLDRLGQEKVRWNFENAWPVKWEGPTFNAAGNDVAIETLEIAHEGIVKREDS